MDDLTELFFNFSKTGCGESAFPGILCKAIMLSVSKSTLPLDNRIVQTCSVSVCSVSDALSGMFRIFTLFSLSTVHYSCSAVRRLEQSFHTLPVCLSVPEDCSLPFLAGLSNNISHILITSSFLQGLYFFFYFLLYFL